MAFSADISSLTSPVSGSVVEKNTGSSQAFGDVFMKFHSPVHLQIAEIENGEQTKMKVFDHRRELDMRSRRAKCRFVLMARLEP